MEYLYTVYHEQSICAPQTRQQSSYDGSHEMKDQEEISNHQYVILPRPKSRQQQSAKMKYLSDGFLSTQQVYHFECDENETIHDNDDMDQHNVYQYVMQLTTNFGQPLLTANTTIDTSKVFMNLTQEAVNAEKPWNIQKIYNISTRCSICYWFCIHVKSWVVTHLTQKRIYSTLRICTNDDGSLLM